MPRVRAPRLGLGVPEIALTSGQASALLKRGAAALQQRGCPFRLPERRRRGLRDCSPSSASQRARGHRVAPRRRVGAERGALASRRAAATIGRPRASYASSYLSRRVLLPFRPACTPRRGRGQGQQIGELAWRRSGLRCKPPRPGQCAALASRPSESEPPAAAPERPAAVPRLQPLVAAAPGAPPWGPGSASGCCCCSLPSCSTRSAAGPLRR